MNGSDRFRAFAARRIAAGLCVKCGRKKDPGRKTWRCGPCVVANRPAGLRYYYKAKREGLCPTCRKIRPQDGHVSCAGCRQAAKDRFARRDSVNERARRGPYESKKLRRLDALTERCACGLLLPCDCEAPARTGAGRTCPEGL